jgi:hypothetical protein
MDTRASTDSPDKPASIAEIVAINIAWLCGLSGFTAGLATQNTGLAFPGLTLFFATFFYTLVRAYHFRRTDHDVVQVSHAHRLATDPFLWVNYLPKAASARRS